MRVRVRVRVMIEWVLSASVYIPLAWYWLARLKQTWLKVRG